MSILKTLIDILYSLIIVFTLMVTIKVIATGTMQGLASVVSLVYILKNREDDDGTGRRALLPSSILFVIAAVALFVYVFSEGQALLALGLAMLCLTTTQFLAGADEEVQEFWYAIRPEYYVRTGIIYIDYTDPMVRVIIYFCVILDFLFVVTTTL